ncbi:MAG: gluconate 2-dehydrogenase subunit 3 family protein [Bacteroidetes bacterium]|nr:gluconate 2-dehydrogenase subunit 3 family protein [Bacteroidota bacterium]MDA1119279.1 gluconate 2-dehydrogenase subunit 3 family protein [Bacteroidota bacterium]
MDRREAIRRTSLALGGMISAPTLAVIMKGCTPSRSLEWQPTLFSPGQAMMIEDVCERIIPTTETPGAKAVGVPQFIESMVKMVYKADARDIFMAGLNDLEQSSQEKFKKSFTKLTEEQQYELLNPLNTKATEEAVENENNSIANGKPSFFRMAKELTITGYCTSEIGATQELQFLDIPGNYDGCVPLEDLGGKAWATS